MNPSSIISLGTCTFGPVYLSASTEEEDKFAISIIEYDGTRHVNLISCKTTSQNHHKVWPGEFILSDLFGHGPTKIQPYNVVRIQKNAQLGSHRHIGRLHSSILPQFEDGLKIAIRKGLFDAKESLDLANSWQRLFPIS